MWDNGIHGASCICMNRRFLAFEIFALSCLGLAGIGASGCNDRDDGVDTAGSNLTNHVAEAGLEDGTPLSRLMLAVVNDRDRSVDDLVSIVRLSKPLAEAIVAVRNGPNLRPESRPLSTRDKSGGRWSWELDGDDEAFTSLRELDALPGSDADAFRRLKQFALAATDGYEVGHPGGSFVTLSAGEGYTCGVRSDMRVVCWGSNTLGQSIPMVFSGVGIAAGGLHTCAIRSFDNSVSCWGYEGSRATSAPAGRFVQVSSGRSHSCGVREDRTIACWGTNTHGQLEAPSGTFILVKAGDVATCALRDDGEVVCWGASSFAPEGKFVQIDVSGMDACGVREDATITCWSTSQPVMALQSFSGTFKHVSVGATGNSPVCAVRTDGTIACIKPFATASAPPPPAPPAGKFRYVAMGGAHGCALTEGDEVICWGDNGMGQAPQP